MDSTLARLVGGGLFRESLTRVSLAEREPYPHAEDEAGDDGKTDEETRQRSNQLIVKLLPTLTGPPENAGMCAPRNLPATQPPTGVPGNGPPSTTADDTEPFGANVIFT